MNIDKCKELVQVVKDNGNRGLECIRRDGLKIFLDKENDSLSNMLNEIRVYSKKEDVILAVGFIRGLQIANNYAKKHCPELVDKMDALTKQISTNYKKKYLKKTE